MAEFKANHQCYDNGHEAFLRSATLHDSLQKCLQEKLPNILQRINVPGNKHYNILSIGSGNGQMDKKFIETFVDQKNSEFRVFNRAVEPSSGSLEQYQNFVTSAASRDPLVQKVTYEFVNKNFDEYTTSNSYSRNQFDLIHAVHSFHLVKDIQQSLQHCYSSELKEKGAIMLIGSEESVSPYSKVGAYMEKFKAPGFSNPRHKGTKWYAEAARLCQYEYDVFPFTYTVDVTEIFSPKDRECQSGDLLLDFFAYEEDFRRNFDSKIVEEVCNIIRNISKEDEKGRLIVEPLDELVVIYKPGKG